jgi:hypothetical protein
MEKIKFFFVDVERDEELVKGERKRLIRGIASTENKDRHNEELLLSGMSFENYLENGHLNWDHMKGPQFLLGKPLEANIVSDASQLSKKHSGPAFYHLCELYDSEPGRAAWDLMKSQENDLKRQLGFSVEGAILETLGSKLIKTRVDDVALTPKPANPETFAEFAKSLTTESGSALLMQYIDDMRDPSETAKQAIHGFKNLSDIMWGDCSHGCYHESGRFAKGAKSAYFHLVKCKGFKEDDALNFVKNLAKSGIL